MFALLNLIKLFWENIITDNLIFIWLMIITLIIMTWIKYKNKELKKYIKNIRFVWRVIVILIMIGIVSLLKYYYDIFHNYPYLIIALFLLTIYLFWRIEHVNLLTRFKLNKINSKIKQGLAIELETYFIINLSIFFLLLTIINVNLPG